MKRFAAGNEADSCDVEQVTHWKANKERISTLISVAAWSAHELEQRDGRGTSLGLVSFHVSELGGVSLLAIVS